MNLVEAEAIVEVPFHDLDPMNVVWHGNYLKYMEIACSKLLEKIGYDYKVMQEDGVVYPVAKVEMKYIKSATFAQKLIIKAILEEFEPALKVKYIIKDAQTNETIFKASAMNICVDVKSGKSVYEAPEKLKEGLKCLSI